ncbi:MAG: helix-turn-helix domain-containing protein, partial [Clostridia bacterium]|nr:helix-turn-helix domain-containing protein [Clostridia bacterium]
MMGIDCSGESNHFFDILKKLDSIYERYAKSVGLTYTGLYVFHTISISQKCTQKYLCDQLFLPKQTINSIIKSFERQGLLEMIELP